MFYREMDQPLTKPPCFSLTGVVVLSALRHQASRHGVKKNHSYCSSSMARSSGLKSQDQGLFQLLMTPLVGPAEIPSPFGEALRIRAEFLEDPNLFLAEMG